MKRTWSRAVVVALGALMLAGSPALAKGKRTPPPAPEQRAPASTCEGECKKDLKECTDMCKKYAQHGADVCTKACREAEQECNQDCKQSRGGD